MYDIIGYGTKNMCPIQEKYSTACTGKQMIQSLHGLKTHS